MNPLNIHTDWGSSGHAWFGRNVVDNLVLTVDRHVQAGTLRRPAAAIGCVPWFTYQPLARQLSKLSCCIVVNKPRRAVPLPSACAELHRSGEGLSTTVLSGLGDMLPRAPTGKPVMIGPWDRMDAIVGPVRIAGYTQSPKGDSPLLHSKILVLGHLWEDDDEYTGEYFVATHAWLGSANWTTRSQQSHLEFGLLTYDRKLVQAAKEFVCEVISLSEQIGSSAQTPQPELVAVTYDDSEFAAVLPTLPFDSEDDDKDQ
jgi:phosphatidylserine/phosphatidylglycerophosphate/cardiolipin synthase-like enzyme